MSIQTNQVTDTQTPTTGTLNVNSQLALPKTTNFGIKVDVASPTFGWRDIIGQVHARGTGPTDPSWTSYRTNINQYQFTVGDEIWSNFHIPHDYVPGTDLFIHAHWSITTTTIENVTWGFDLTYAKGYSQAAFPATVNATVAQGSNGTAYTHNIAEVQITGGGLLTLANIEVDGVIMCRTYVSANSGADEPYLHFVDIHYQSTNMATKAKAPNFYV